VGPGRPVGVMGQSHRRRYNLPYRPDHGGWHLGAMGSAILGIIRATQYQWDAARILGGEINPHRAACVRAYLEAPLAGQGDVIFAPKLLCSMVWSVSNVTREQATIKRSRICGGVRPWPCENHAIAKQSLPSGDRPSMSGISALTLDQKTMAISWRLTWRPERLRATAMIMPRPHAC
jgi:hypothetical protein